MYKLTMISLQAGLNGNQAWSHFVGLRHNLEHPGFEEDREVLGLDLGSARKGMNGQLGAAAHGTACTMKAVMDDTVA